MIGKTLLVLAAFLAVQMVVEAQVGAPCHARIFQFTPRHNINISAYMGEWYMHEIAGSDIGNFPAPAYKCASRSLSLPNGTDITRIKAVDSLVNTTSGLTVVQNSDITINNTRSPFTSMWYMNTEQVQSDVIILHADLEFQQWTTVYSCAILEPNGYRYETVTAMTRSRTITPEHRQFLKALMVGQGFRIGDHQQISQENC